MSKRKQRPVKLTARRDGIAAHHMQPFILEPAMAIASGAAGYSTHGRV